MPLVAIYGDSRLGKIMLMERSRDYIYSCSVFCDENRTLFRSHHEFVP